MREFAVKYSPTGVWYGVFTALAAKGIKHGISTRIGGLSNPPFTSLNLGLHTGDQADLVWKNRQLFCQSVGVSAEQAVTAEQVHGDRISVVTAQDAGRGARLYDEAIKGADALITNVPGIPLMLFFADCVPVLIFDPIAKAIGLSHAGWKGTVAKIAQKTLLAMQANYNTRPSDCIIGIGPSIGQCCYEVDNVVIEKLKTNFLNWEELAKPDGEHWCLNLWEANRSQLIEIGVRSSNITISSVCTSCNTTLFFSHRAEAGRTGRIGAVIAITDKV